MGAIDGHLRKLLPSSFVCLVQHQAGKALSLETSSNIALRLTKSKKHILQRIIKLTGGLTTLPGSEEGASSANWKKTEGSLVELEKLDFNNFQLTGMF